MTALLTALRTTGFLDGTRRVVVRAFPGRAEALRLMAAQAQDMASIDASNLRFHVLIGATDAPSTLTAMALIDAAVSDGFDGVEFEYTQPELTTRVAYARAKGLATGVWTVPVFLGEPTLAALQDSVDLVVTDLEPALASVVATEVTPLLHLDVARVAPTASVVPYLQSGLDPFAASVGLANTPLLVAPGPSYQTTLAFETSASRSLATWDADHAPGDGYLVAVAASFDQLALPDYGTQVLVGKADAGGFSLELANAADGLGTVLRFGVHVGGGYVYARRPAAGLVAGRMYMIVGAYDGSGGVRLLVDGSDADVTWASATGQVTPNDVPIVLGADPQGLTGRRWWFSGRLQAVHVASWSQF